MDQSFSIGCDPEFFFRTNEGKIIEAKDILPQEGLKAGSIYASKFTIDGVQAELNPRPDTCRANLANEISHCFRKLRDTLAIKNSKIQGIKPDFSQTIKFTKKELEALDEKSRKLGCSPSKNTYNAEAKITINPDTYKYRSAGGHIHLGRNEDSPSINKALECPEKTIFMLDIILGNTCVLIDRDWGNIERRKVYGQAGEYRTPNHGLEYRTLSNFWLTSYPLMSLVTGLAREVVQLVADTKEDYYEAFVSKIRKIDIIEAINNNDFDLAMSNFNKIKDLLMEVTPNDVTGRYPITSSNIKEFHYFIEKGIEHWFKEDPLTHWCNLPEGHNGGFYDFLNKQVCTEMNMKKTKAAA